jgi:hypothetical protein
MRPKGANWCALSLLQHQHIGSELAQHLNSETQTTTSHVTIALTLPHITLSP